MFWGVLMSVIAHSFEFKGWTCLYLYRSSWKPWKHWILPFHKSVMERCWLYFVEHVWEYGSVGFVICFLTCEERKVMIQNTVRMNVFGKINWPLKIPGNWKKKIFIWKTAQTFCNVKLCNRLVFDADCRIWQSVGLDHLKKIYKKKRERLCGICKHSLCAVGKFVSSEH